MTRAIRSLLIVVTLIGGSIGLAQEPTTRDVEYATVGGTALKLDLYLPAKRSAPLIVWVHGGAWRAGSKESPPYLDLVDQGYAIASVDYRLSTQAPFPAQIHDIKAAIRFLRAKAPDYGYDASRIGIMGSSAGGHLAALVGVTNGNKELEGTVGGCLKESSDVQCIISLFGASNLQSILSQSTEYGLKVRVPALQLLLGDHPDKVPDLAKLASPVAHVGKNDPPLLLIHGTADPQMPPQQSEELAKAYEALKLPVRLNLIVGAKHGGREFNDAQRRAIMSEFLESYLRRS
jgi:acetyl esterase/lipase